MPVNGGNDGGVDVADVDVAEDDGGHWERFGDEMHQIPGTGGVPAWKGELEMGEISV